jgi:hypothetical protein
MTFGTFYERAGIQNLLRANVLGTDNRYVGSATSPAILRVNVTNESVLSVTSPVTLQKAALLLHPQ